MADVAQWIECQPENQNVTSSIPSQGTYKTQPTKVYLSGTTNRCFSLSSPLPFSL